MTINDAPAVIIGPTLAINGSDNIELSDRLVELTITDDQTGLYRCEALFNNWGTVETEFGYVLSDRQLLDFGKEFSVSYGPDNDQLFTGRIMGMEGLFLANGARLLRILGEDKLQDLRMTRRTRHFGGESTVTDADVINQIAQNHGLEAELDIETVSHQCLTQVNESDLAFLRRRARALDADIWLDEDTIHVIARHRHTREPSILRFQSDLIEFVVLADLTEQRTALRVTGWDAVSKEAISFEATESVIQNELRDLESGVSLLSEAIGERKEVIAHTVPLDSSAVEAQAKSYFRTRARRFVTGTAIVSTVGRYRVGQYVRFRELDILFDGDYVITGIQHLFDRVGGGMRTELLVERPGIGQ